MSNVGRRCMGAAVCPSLQVGPEAAADAVPPPPQPPPLALASCWRGAIALLVVDGSAGALAAGVAYAASGAAGVLACWPGAWCRVPSSDWRPATATRPLGEPRGDAVGLLLGEGAKRRLGDEAVGDEAVGLRGE